MSTEQKTMRCARCRRMLGHLTWDEAKRRVNVVVSVSAEGEDARVRGLRTANSGQRVEARRGAHWWDHTPGGGNLDREPTRYKYDCGGRHRSTTRFITVDTLTDKYRAAVARRDPEIPL